MKYIALALIAAVVLAAYPHTQASAQTATPPAAAPPASSDGKLSHACKKEVKDLCGRAHGDEMKDCVKSGLDMNKFSANCKTELAKAPPKPAS